MSPITYSIDNVPADDEIYIYGLGVDTDHNNAQKLALGNITQKLSTRVQSSIDINQRKIGNSSNIDIKQRTTAVSQDIELPNVYILESTKKKQKWWVLLRVERRLVQLALKQQIDDLNDELSFLIDDFSESQGPSCWFMLTKNVHKKERLAALIPAYIGSGIKKGVTESLKQQAVSFDRLLNRCKYNNKYTVIYPPRTPTDFKNAFEQLMKNQSYKIVNTKPNTGKITLKYIENKTYTFKNYLNIINAEITISDEFSNIQKHIKFKGKGSSFKSEKDANKKAITHLIKKIKHS